MNIVRCRHGYEQMKAVTMNGFKSKDAKISLNVDVAVGCTSKLRLKSQRLTNSGWIVTTFSSKSWKSTNKDDVIPGGG